jgi:hypothetical protein
MTGVVRAPRQRRVEHAAGVTPASIDLPQELQLRATIGRLVSCSG